MLMTFNIKLLKPARRYLIKFWVKKKKILFRCLINIAPNTPARVRHASTLFIFRYNIISLEENVKACFR